LSREAITLSIDAYAEVQDIVRIKYLLETLLGLEIVEKGHAAVDRQKLTHKLWEKE